MPHFNLILEFNFIQFFNSYSSHFYSHHPSLKLFEELIFNLMEVFYLKIIY